MQPGAPEDPSLLPGSAAPLARASRGRGVWEGGVVSRRSAPTPSQVKCSSEAPATDDSKLHTETDVCPEPKGTESCVHLLEQNDHWWKRMSLLAAKLTGTVALISKFSGQFSISYNVDLFSS